MELVLELGLWVPAALFSLGARIFNFVHANPGVASFIGAVVGAWTLSVFQRRQVMFVLADIYQSSQDMMRSAIALPTSHHQHHANGKPPKEVLNGFAIQHNDWWQEARRIGPVMSKRGRRFLTEIFKDCAEVQRCIEKVLDDDDPNGEYKRNACELITRIGNHRERMTADRRLLITFWPERLDWFRLRFVDRPDEMSRYISH